MVDGQVRWNAASAENNSADAPGPEPMEQGASIRQAVDVPEGRAGTDVAARRRIAVLVPCFNEEAAINRVVRDFRASLPGAVIYVYDNNSTDRTAEVALVARHGLDIVQGDLDDEATLRRALAGAWGVFAVQNPLEAGVDQEEAAYRRGHRMGNRLLTGFVAHVFGAAFDDMLSGYRVLSRRFVKSFPVLSSGFEIETELTIHALNLELPVGEVETPYYARLAGSVSKLSTWRDGLRILATIVRLYRAERPLPFFAGIGASLAVISIVLAIPVFVTYLEQGLVPRMPTAVLSTGLMILACLSIACGLVLDTVTRGRREIKLLAYLAQSAPGKEEEP